MNGVEFSPTEPFKLCPLPIDDTESSIPIHIPVDSLWHPSQQFLVIHLLEQIASTSDQKKHVVQSIVPFIIRQFDYQNKSAEQFTSYYFQAVCAYRALDFGMCLELVLKDRPDDDFDDLNALKFNIWKKNLAKIKHLVLFVFVSILETLKPERLADVLLDAGKSSDFERMKAAETNTEKLVSLAFSQLLNAGVDCFEMFETFIECLLRLKSLKEPAKAVVKGWIDKFATLTFKYLTKNVKKNPDNIKMLVPLVHFMEFDTVGLPSSSLLQHPLLMFKFIFIPVLKRLCQGDFDIMESLNSKIIAVESIQGWINAWIQLKSFDYKSIDLFRAKLIDWSLENTSGPAFRNLLFPSVAVIISNEHLETVAKDVILSVLNGVKCTYPALVSRSYLTEPSATLTTKWLITNLLVEEDTLLIDERLSFNDADLQIFSVEMSKLMVGLEDVIEKLLIKLTSKEGLKLQVALSKSLALYNLNSVRESTQIGIRFHNENCEELRSREICDERWPFDCILNACLNNEFLRQNYSECIDTVQMWSFYLTSHIISCPAFKQDEKTWSKLRFDVLNVLSSHGKNDLEVNGTKHQTSLDAHQVPQRVLLTSMVCGCLEALSSTDANLDDLAQILYRLRQDASHKVRQVLLSALLKLLSLKRPNHTVLRLIFKLAKGICPWNNELVVESDYLDLNPEVRWILKAIFDHGREKYVFEYLDYEPSRTLPVQPQPQLVTQPVLDEPQFTSDEPPFGLDESSGLFTEKVASDVSSDKMLTSFYNHLNQTTIIPSFLHTNDQETFTSSPEKKPASPEKRVSFKESFKFTKPDPKAILREVLETRVTPTRNIVKDFESPELFLDELDVSDDKVDLDAFITSAQDSADKSVNTFDGNSLVQESLPIVRSDIYSTLKLLLSQLSQSNSGLHPELLQVFELDPNLFFELGSCFVLPENGGDADEVIEALSAELKPVSDLLWDLERKLKQPVSVAQSMIIVKDQISILKLAKFQ